MRRLAILVTILSVGLTACGKDEPSAGRIEYARGPSDLVLRVDLVGGFVPTGFRQTHLPPFSLFGDGTVITEGPQIEIFPPPALPSIVSRTVAEDGVQRILQAARTAGLFGQDANYQDPMIADASTTVFTVIEGGRRHRIEVVALAESVNPQLPAGDRTVRAQLSAFQQKLTDLASWIEANDLGPERSYEGAAMRVIVQPYLGTSEPEQEPKDWPLAKALKTFGTAMEAGLRCGIVAGSELATMRAAASRANADTPWHQAGKVYRLSFRPMLPDEEGC